MQRQLRRVARRGLAGNWRELLGWTAGWSRSWSPLEARTTAVRAIRDDAGNVPVIQKARNFRS